MNFVLQRTTATEVHLRQVQDIVPDQVVTGPSQPLTLRFDHGFASDATKFMVRFRAEAWIAKAPPTKLDVTFISDFLVDHPLSEEEKNSHFVLRNAPAIAFPFLRSYIAHITLLAGYTPLIIAPINFAHDMEAVKLNDPELVITPEAPALPAH